MDIIELYIDELERQYPSDKKEIGQGESREATQDDIDKLFG